MSRLPALPALALALTLSTLAPAAAQSVADVNDRADMLFGDHETLEDAFVVIQQAVADGNAETLAALIKYPLAVTISEEEYVLEGEQAFVDFYPDIITPDIEDTILSQDYADLFLNQDGAMFGDGEVWMTPVCIDSSCSTAYWLISAINNN